MKFTASALLSLLPLISAMDVTFYAGTGCSGDNLGNIVAGDGTNREGREINFGDVRPASMNIVSDAGYGFSLLLAQDDNPGCAVTGACCYYCGDYYSERCGFTTGETRCVDINTGYGPEYALVTYQSSNNPGQLPCNNYQYRCPFPEPPANGMCAQT